MTKVSYSEKNDEILINIEGHAGYDKIGSDIVCSAISILGQTLLAYLQTSADVFDYSMKSGKITAYAKGKDVRTALSVVMAGYWLIEQNYPDHLSIDRGCSIQRDIKSDKT